MLTGELAWLVCTLRGFSIWCDVVTDLAPDPVALVINGQYYRNGGRDYAREKQLANYSLTSVVRTNVEVKYTVGELQANIIFG